MANFSLLRFLSLFPTSIPSAHALFYFEATVLMKGWLFPAWHNSKGTVDFSKKDAINYES